MLGLGEGLLELRKVGDVTGPFVGAPSHRWAVCGGMGEVRLSAYPTAPCVRVTWNQALCEAGRGTPGKPLRS